MIPSPQAMAVKALPPNIPSALETLALMVDDIWYMAGDKSVDINWYTKRALLASLYTSTGNNGEERRGGGGGGGGG